MSYTQLNLSERFTLYELHTIEKLSLQGIVTQMKRSKNTISRELRRSRSNAVHYLPDTAQVKMQEQLKPKRAL